MRVPVRAGVATTLAAFLPPIAIYAITLQPGLPAGDSGELITAAATGGVAHPPGYPLYVMLAGAWIRLVPFGDVAWRANLLSAVCAAAAAAVLAAAVHRLTASRAGAVLAAWAFALSAPTWQNAVVAEVFALNALLAACVLLAFTHTRAAAGAGARAAARSKRPTARPAAVPGAGDDAGLLPVCALALLTTLALSHHHTLLFLAAPAAAVALAAEVRAGRGARAAPAMAVAAAIGLLPLAWLPFASRHPDALVWGDATTLRGFLALVTRADYGSLRLDPVEAALRADRSHLAIYAESLPRALGVLPLALAVVGACVVAARHRPLAIVLALFVAGQAWFFTRVGFPSGVDWLRGVIQRFYILPDLALAALAGVGFAWVLTRLPRGGRLPAVSAALALGVTLVLPLARHPRAADQRGNVFAESLGRMTLAGVPRGGVLFVQGDLFHNAAMYLTRVRHLRPDVTVLDQELMTYDWYVRRVRARMPGLLPGFGRAQRLRLRDGRTLEGIAILRGGEVDVIADSAQGTLAAADLASAVEAPPESLYRAARARFRDEPLHRMGEDRYSGLPGTRNLLWFDHLTSRRPVAVIGVKDESYVLRYALTPVGLVQWVTPAAATPDPAAQLAASLAVFESAPAGAYFRDYDVASFEHAERARIARFVSRTALLCCQPGAAAPIAAHASGHARLLEFAGRFEALDPTPDPDCLRSIGFLRAFDPVARDSAAARRDLERYLASMPAGTRDPEVQIVLSGGKP